MNRRIFVLVLLGCVLSSSASAEKRKTKVPPLRAGMVVSTDWLADHLNDPSVVILYVGQKRSDYDAAHVPGARFLSLESIAVERDGLKNQLPPAADLGKLFSELGVSDSSRVILYGGHQGLFAARAYWTLDYLGHGDTAALLDGGLEKWRNEERPVTSVVRNFSPGTFTVRLNPKVLTDFAQVQKYSRNLGDGDTTVALIDSRTADDYAGQSHPTVLSRYGHIPGAANVYWQQFLESTDHPELRPSPEMRQLFIAAGATPGTKVVTYCNTGMQAAFNYFVAKFLGYDVSLYDGSAQEWNNAKDTQVITGK